MNLSFDERVRPFELPLRGDARGLLLPFDFETLPFAPKRLFVVTGVPAGGVRGRHAHRHSWQLFACVAGRIDVLARLREHTRRLSLDRPGQAMLVGPHVWCEQTYRDPQSTLLVLASEPHATTQYLDHWNGDDGAAA